MGTVRVALIAFSIASIFSIGLTSIPANAQFTQFQNCFVHVQWEDPLANPGVPQPPSPVPLDFDTDCPFPLHPISPTLICDPPDTDPLGTSCFAQIPNFIDELDHKIIFIDVTYGPTDPFPFTLDPVTTCKDASTGDTIGNVFDSGFDASGLFIYDIECLPNPDWEQIEIFLPSSVIRVEFWTETFDDLRVGGTFIPIDTTTLLLAGVQSISMWMIPVVAAGVVIGVFVIKRRK